MYFQLTTLLFLSTVGVALTISDSTSGHINRHRAIRQHTSANSSRDLHVVKAVQKPRSRRSGGKTAHCQARLKTTTASALNVTSEAVGSVNDTSDITTTITASDTPSPTTTTTSSAETTTTTHSAKHTTSYAAETTTSTTSAPAPTPSAGVVSQTYTGGDATYYGIGLGACGWDNSEPDMIAAMAYGMFDSYAKTAAEEGNPNLNPVCGKMVTASLPGLGSVTVKIVDRCAGCIIGTSLDFSEAAFNKLTNNGMAVGRFHDLSWYFID